MTKIDWWAQGKQYSSPSETFENCTEVNIIAPNHITFRSQTEGEITLLGGSTKISKVEQK